ncbi:Lipid-phosphate phosphatase [Hyphodiscus hymeniophilus]|uniref:Lipid-phosphate phosphatase n=1 Tax=Hyphodiscus hymeniophilus TaxID=353542 RepID=A0A9P6VP86_9HELO|nr:Lipid-phosphate phosphatase [Hyphodiscus hymeniophilus]
MTIQTPNKTLTLASGTRYAYFHYPGSKQTLLFLHGFPSTSHDWRFQIAYFRSRGYGIVAPDLLGYGGSSKPLNPEAYLGSIMSADIISILDHEGITGPVIGIAHDWGTYLLSQLACRYPSRFSKFVFLSEPYGPPGRAMDVHRINKTTKRQMGFEQFGYWLFFSEDGAGKTIGQNKESFLSLVYAENPSIWKTSFAPVDGMRQWLATGSHTHLAPYITEEDEEHHYKAFGNDYSGPVMWYKRGIRSLGSEEEKEMLATGEIKNGGRIGKETLMITGLKDVVCTSARARLTMKSNVETGKLKVVDLDAGHWIMLEKAEQTNSVLEKFIEEGVGVKSVL